MRPWMDTTVGDQGWKSRDEIPWMGDKGREMDGRPGMGYQGWETMDGRPRVGDQERETVDGRS